MKEIMKKFTNIYNIFINDILLRKTKKDDMTVNKQKEKIKTPILGLDDFIKDFIKGLDNVFIMSTLYRMLDTNSFIKFGKTIYAFSDEEKEKLAKLKPLLGSLVDDVAAIQTIQKGE